MCGATGEVRLDGRTPDVAAVAAMAETMVPRGPDGAGVWAQGRVALGHRRLKIIDLAETGAQQGVPDRVSFAVGEGFGHARTFRRRSTPMAVMSQ